MNRTPESFLTERTETLGQSDIRAITDMVRAADGINLGQGICDLPTPEPIKERARQAITDNRSIYTHYAGIEQLREGILGKAQRYNGLPARSTDEVMVGVGATGTFVTAVLSLIEPGEEVILFEPFYGYHRNLLELLGARVRYVPTSPPDWAVDFEALETAITRRTKALVLNTPSNPSGKVWSQEELERLAKLMREHDLIAITDEIYEYMLYDGAEHISLGALSGAYERTVTISGFSKTYNMTGWRLGYAVGPAAIIEKMGLINDLMYICAARPLQHGVTAAFEEMDDAYFEEMMAAYRQRRQLMCETLEAIGFDVPWPAGAYYVFASFEPLAQRPGFSDDKAAAQTLVQEAGVGTVSGRSFFSDPEKGRYLLRFCFAKEIPELEEACERLVEAFG